MNERSLWIIFGAVFLLLLLLVLAFLLFRPVQVQSVPAEVRVDSAIGFKLDNDKFYFGRVRPGASANRYFTFVAPFDAVLLISSSGDAGDWIIPSKQSLFVAKDKSYPLQLVLSVPLNTSFSNYTADVHFTLYRPFTKHFFVSSRG